MCLLHKWSHVLTVFSTLSRAASVCKKISTNHMTQHHFSPQFDKSFSPMPATKLHSSTTIAHSVFCCYESYRNSIESFSYTQEIAGNSYFLLFPLYERSLNFFIGVSCAALVRIYAWLDLSPPESSVSCNSYLAFQSHTCMDRHRLDIFILHRKGILKFWITVSSFLNDQEIRSCHHKTFCPFSIFWAFITTTPEPKKGPAGQKIPHKAK